MCLINVLGGISVLGGHTAHLFSPLSAENEFSPISAENEVPLLACHTGMLIRYTRVLLVCTNLVIIDVLDVFSALKIQKVAVIYWHLFESDRAFRINCCKAEFLLARIFYSSHNAVSYTHLTLPTIYSV